MSRHPTGRATGRKCPRGRRRSHGIATATGIVALLCSPLPDTALAQPAAPTFVEVTEELGVDFVHRHFGTGEKYMPENMGSGVAVFDADGDGDLDLYFVQGAPWTPRARSTTPEERRTNRLFLRDGGRFREVSESGLEDPGYGMGVAVGDVDGDGLDDVLVTNFGVNRLYRNLGDGRFADETEQRGLLGDGNAAGDWSTGAAFFDADADGDLDLYVANYLDFSLEDHRFCGSAARGIRSYCHPDVYAPQPDAFFRNLGDGTFADATEELGFADPAFASQSKGLGVFAGDLDGDGSQDVYVANDSTRNLLFLGGGERFREEALLAGLGYSGVGRPEAGMGIAAGDTDGDGLVDLLLTHLDEETNTLYRNRGSGMFADATTPAGLSSPSLPWVGFGTQLFDMDLDGDLDLFVANGHIIDNIRQFDDDRRHLQPAQLFENRGGRFSEVSSRLGLDERHLAGRSAVAVDWDEDGDLDRVVTQNGREAILLENRLEGGRSVTVRLRSSTSAPDGVGARLTLRRNASAADADTETDTGAADGFPREIVRWMHSTTGYLSQPPRRITLALPETSSEEPLELVVAWPSGRTQQRRLAGDTDRGTLLVLEEPGG